MFKEKEKNKNENFILPIFGCYENWCFKSTGNWVSVFILLILAGVIIFILIKKYNLSPKIYELFQKLIK